MSLLSQNIASCAAAPATVILFYVSTICAAPIIKSNNTNSINLGTSWVGGVAPTATEVAVWNDSVTGALSCALAANCSWLGLVLTNPGGPGTLTNNKLLHVLGSGIDMSAATQDFTIACQLWADVDQTWNINDRTLFITTQGYNGAGRITKTGNGTVTNSIGGANPGGFTLNAGTYNLNNVNMPCAAAATFIISGVSTIDNTSAGAITLAYNNPMTWNANFTFTGTQNLNMGTGAVTLGATRTLTCNGSTLTIGGAIGGAGFGLTKAGVGALALAGAGTYTGATTINEGTILLNANVTASANSPLGNAASAVLVGSSAAGTNNASLLNNGAFTITRPITIQSGNSGTATLGGNTAASSSFTTGAMTLNKGVILSAIASGTATFSGVISGAYTVTKSGAGIVILSGAASANTFSDSLIVTAGELRLSKSDGVNACAGHVRIGNGDLTDIVKLVNNQQIPNTKDVNIVGGTLDLASNSKPETITALSMNAGAVSGNATGFLTIGGNVTTYAAATSATISGKLDLGAATRTLTVADGAAAADLDVSAIIQVTGAFGIVKEGTGLMKISGVNTYTGTTSVNAGELLVTGSTHVSSAVTAQTTGILSGTGTCNGAVTIATDGAIKPGNSSAAILNVGGALTLNENSTLTFTLGASSDQIVVGGALTLDGQLDVTDGGGFATGTYILMTYAGALTVNNTLTIRTLPANFSASINVNAVPNPDRVELIVTSYVWDGSTDGTWSTGANWVGASAPNGNDFVIYNGSATANRTGQNNDIVGLTGMSFYVGAVPTGNVSVTAGNSIQLAGGTSIDMSTAARDLTLGIPLALSSGSAETWNVKTVRTLTISGALSGTDALTFPGAGTVVLSGNNSGYTGGITATGGAITAKTSANCLGPSTNTVTLNGTSLRLEIGTAADMVIQDGDGSAGYVLQAATEDPVTSDITLQANASIQSDAGVGGFTLGGIVSESGGSYGIIILGTETNANECVSLSNHSNSYTGTTAVTSAMMAVGDILGAIPDGSAVVLGNNTGIGLLISDVGDPVAVPVAETIGSLSGGGATGGDVTLGNGTLTIGYDNTSPAAFAGKLIPGTGGTGSIVKIGTGTLTLAGANTYTGTTTVSVGTLSLTGSTHASSAASVSAGATLAGTGTVNGTLTLATGSPGGTLSPGTSATPATFSTAGATTMASGAAFVVNIAGNGSNDKLSRSGANACNLASATLTLTLAYPPSPTDAYTIIDNTNASGTITNQFSCGTSTTADFSGTTYNFTINYSGGTNSNDVVVTCVATGPTPFWSQNTLGTIRGGAITPSSLYLGHGTTLSCRNLATGAALWSKTTTNACKMPSYCYIGGVYKVLAAEGDMVIGVQHNADNSKTDLFEQTISTGATVGNPYISYNGLSFYVTYTGNITQRTFADPSNGAGVRTKALATVSTSADIVVSQDYLYVATTTGDVNKYDQDFTLLGSYTPYSTGTSINLPLAMPNNTMYVTPATDKVYAVTTNGMSNKYPATSPLQYSPSGTNNSGAAYADKYAGTIYTAAGTYVYKITDNGSSIAQTWVSPAANAQISSGPVCYAGKVYYGCDGATGRYYALTDAGATCSMVATWPYTPTSGAASVGPWIDITNSRVIFGTTGGYLDAFTLP